MSSSTSNSSLEETKQLNSQSAANKGNSGVSNSNAMSNMSSSTSNSALEETKQLNNQSAANKGK